jgi:hypothetical protein
MTTKAQEEIRVPGAAPEQAAGNASPFGINLIREACSGVTWCPATPTTLREATLGGPWHAAGGSGGDADVERWLLSVPPPLALDPLSPRGLKP